MTKDLTQEPGTTYHYNSGGTHLLSVILTLASGKSTLEYAQEKLFTPLGIQQVKWGKLKDGNYDGAGFSLEMLPKDLVKIGSIFLHANQNEPAQLVPKAWLEKMNRDDLKPVSYTHLTLPTICSV